MRIPLYSGVVIDNSLAKLLEMAAVCKVMLFVLFLFPLCNCGFPRREWEGMLKAPPRPKGIELPSAQWFQQKLNHFNSTDARTWKQRYFVNDTNWDRSGGPVFLMLGGEAEASPTWLTVNSEIMANAEKYKALVVLIEHRYFEFVCVNCRLYESSLGITKTSNPVQYVRQSFILELERTPSFLCMCSG